MFSSVETTFDLNRALLLDHPLQETLTVKTFIPLQEALRRSLIEESAQVQIAELATGTLVFPTWQLLAHPIAEGEWDGDAFAAALCAVCNSTTIFDPTANGTRHHFTQGGLYNGMMLMRDSETGSFWDHITGEALHGPLKGTSLKRLNTLLFMNARQAAVAYPNAMIINNTLSAAQQESAQQRDSTRLQPEPDYGRLGPILAKTLGVEDPRLPRLEMGLGVWTDKIKRYYPLQKLHAVNNLILDTLDGRKLLIYVDVESGTPAAVYVETSSAVWQGQDIRLDNKAVIRDGLLIDADGQPHAAEHPSQLFQRWFGFALTFAGCELYGE